MPIYNPPISASSGVPILVASGVTYTVPTNTQVVYANVIVTQSGGIVLTTGTAALTYVN